METLYQRKFKPKQKRAYGAAITEYIIILGAALFGTIFVYQQYGKGVRFHGATLSKELAGVENQGEIWSPTPGSLASGGYKWGGGSSSGSGGNGNSGGGVGGPGGGNPGGGSGSGDPGGGNPGGGNPGGGNPGGGGPIGGGGFPGGGGGLPGGGGSCPADPGSGPVLGGSAPTFSFAGNPINLVNGNKYQVEIDYRAGGTFGLVWTRHYNSLHADRDNGLGHGWRHEYQRSIVIDAVENLALVYRQDGEIHRFQLREGVWQGPASVVDELVALQGVEGEVIGYRYHGGGMVEDYNAEGRLQQITHYSGLTQSLFYDRKGRLSRVEDAAGRTFDLHYRGIHLSGVDGPEGFAVRYGYGEHNNLTEVSFGKKGALSFVVGLGQQQNKHYRYEDLRVRHALTAIEDETGERFASWSYDASGRAISSQHGKGAEKVGIDYRQDGTVGVTNALGKTAVYHFVNVGGAKRVAKIVGEATQYCAQARQEHIYYDSGFVKVAIDAEGNTTLYERNGRGLVTKETRGYRHQGGKLVASTSMQQTETRWHAHLPLPAQVAYRGTDSEGQWQDTLRVDNDYDLNGHLVKRTLTDLTRHEQPYITYNTQRVYRYKYAYHDTAHTQLAQIKVNGPREAKNGGDDITVYDYDRQGNLARVTNALGHQTHYREHTALGMPQRVIDANGLESRLIYNYRGWLLSATQHSTQSEIPTRLDYYNNGLIKTITLADESAYTFHYNAARQLTKLINHRDESIVFEVNPLHGQWQQASIYGADRQLVQRHQRQFDELGRVIAVLGNNGQHAQFQHDKNNNLLQIQPSVDRNGDWVLDKRRYDALNRLRQLVDASGGVTAYDYNALGQLASVTAANEAETRYTYNGFGDLIELDSPDTGRLVKHYDSAGNVIHSHAADGDSGVRYRYDMLNRLTDIHYPSNAGEPGENDVHYRYDVVDKAHKNSIGRLSYIEDGTGTISYSYDDRGNVVSDTRQFRIGETYYRYSTGYHYSAANRLDAITYPDGKKATYHYHDGQVVSVSWISTNTPNAQPVDIVLLSDIRYQPFGVPIQWTYGNALTQHHIVDLDKRVTRITLKKASTNRQLWQRDYDYDNVNNIIAIDQIVEQTQYRQQFGYDRLNRLIDDVGPYGHKHYDYDSVGNRTRQTTSDKTLDYSYQPKSNRLLKAGEEQILRDGIGNTVVEYSTAHDARYTYNPQNRLTGYYQSKQLKASYAYNALGQRTHKFRKGDKSDQYTVFHYGLHGELLAETNIANGQFSHINYVWLEQQVVARAETGKGERFNGERISYIHSDHLNTPRLATDENNNIVWRWDSDAFGMDSTIISGDSGKVRAEQITVNLRFPGQYRDEESGLFYNYYRTYDPQQGRYTQSDPIGLRAGLNTYAYVDSNPLRKDDPLGLFKVEAGGLAGFFVMPIHESILQTAFNRFNTNYNNVFSQHTINLFIQANVRADLTASGQFSNQHFDQPVDPSFDESKRNPKTGIIENIQTGAPWIQDTLNGINNRRQAYAGIGIGGVVEESCESPAIRTDADISTLVTNFGTNSHGLADFYAHSNWVDPANRGGNYIQQVRSGPRGRNRSTVETGRVPNGLGKTIPWDETVSDGLYTGQAAGCSDFDCATKAVLRGETGAYDYSGYYHNLEVGGDRFGNEDFTTHAYWAKDTPDKPGFDMARDLAIRHTVTEIERLWEKAAQTEGLQEIFRLTLEEKQERQIKYRADNRETCDLCPSFDDQNEIIDYVDKYMKKKSYR